MREALIVCGGLPAEASAGDVVELDVSRDAPAYRRIDFDTAKLCAPLVDDLPAVLADALELAAYIYCADRLVMRGGGKTGRGVGGEWARHLVFRIPVRCHDLWLRPEVRSRLVDTLSFLSGDRFIFEFVPTIRPVSLEPHLGFGDRNAQTIRPDTVMLFSGGLDSLAGVAADIICRGRRAILVTHQSANAIIDLQDRLAEQIGAKTTDRSILYLPVRLRRGQDQPREHSQRLRSFLFATLGLAYARMFGINTVHFYENGITSFNLPVAEHVIGTRASRTTHPQVLAAYGSLFSLLLEESVSFVNPFIWNTKADVVRLIVENGCGDLIRLTTSCASVREYSMTRHQCGVCSQCVERRIAMVAGGAEEADEPYGQDMFVGPIEDATALTMIGGHLLRARRLAAMSQHAFLSNHGQLFRSFGCAGVDPATAVEQTYGLHRRYGTEFIEAVNKSLSRHATIDGVRGIQGQSLLGMLLTPLQRGTPFSDPTESEPTATTQAAATPAPRMRTIVLAFDDLRQEVKFADGPVIGGKGYQILKTLHDQGELSAQSSSVDADRPFCPTRRFLELLDTEEELFRQRVSRLRRSLADGFEARTGYRLDRDDVIQSREWQGYRLNPFVIVVPLHQLPLRRKRSRPCRQAVTALADRP